MNITGNKKKKKRHHLRSSPKLFCLPLRADVWLERGAWGWALLAAPFHNWLQAEEGQNTNYWRSQTALEG